VFLLLLAALLVGCQQPSAPTPIPAPAPTLTPAPAPPAPAPAPAPPLPAQFEIISLDIEPREVIAEETVTITAKVKNIGGSEGFYTAILTINGVEVDKKDITIAPGTSGVVTFSVIEDKPGTYQVAVGDLSSIFTVRVTTSPYDLQGAINKMPEFYAEEVSEDVKVQYEDVISQLPLDAQRWITNMGQFMEDKSISTNEINLVEVLTRKEDPLFYLTRPQIMDGVTSKEVSEVEKDNTQPHGYMYLKHDIEYLKNMGLFSDNAEQALLRVIELANDNYELRKGLYLIGHFGHPRATLFKYKVPVYNTHLFVLGKLLEKGIPEGYERVALAAALDYGSLITIGDSQLCATVPDYAYSMLKFIVETDEVVKGAGGNWRAKDYPLEADFGLVWGAPATRYWASKKGPIWWCDVFRSRRMTVEDFNWLFVDIDTLRSMQDWMIKKGFVDLSVRDPAIDREDVTLRFPTEYYDDTIDKLMAKLNDYLYFGKSHFRGKPNELVDVEGKKVLAGSISNPDWQWSHFLEMGDFYGTCGEDTTTENMMAKSIGISSCHGFIFAKRNGHIYTHTIIRYYNPTNDMLKTTPCQAYFYETTGDEGSPPVSHDGYIYIPWNNFYEFREKWGTFHHRDSDSRYTVYANGFPPGYIFRKL